MEPLLTFEEARVFGCLLEKEMATPDYYPMTVSSLLTACNQTTSRDPVVNFDEATVEEALSGLRRKKLAAMVHLPGSRAPKYRHLALEYFPGLQRPELALLAVLLLRGAQTAAELRTRTERLYAFPDAAALETSLSRLTEYQTGPLARSLPVSPGRRAATWIATLGPAPAAAIAAPVFGPIADWRADIEAQLAALRARVEALESALGMTSAPASQEEAAFSQQ